jgi:hypothetical protein
VFEYPRFLRIWNVIDLSVSVWFLRTAVWFLATRRLGSLNAYVGVAE